ncbi:hypothetical protein V6N13_113856 [Hibiscus sabdariffa]
MDKEKMWLEDLFSVILVARVTPGMVDKLNWVHYKARIFSVKKLTQLMLNDGLEVPIFDYNRIWKLKVPPKIKNLLWVLKIDMLPTKIFLSLRGLECDENLVAVCYAKYNSKIVVDHGFCSVVEYLDYVE